MVLLNVQKTYFWSQETPCSVLMLVPLCSPWSIKGSGMPSRTYSLGSHLQFRETEHDQWSLTTLSHAFIISKTGVTILFVTLWPRVSGVNQGHAKRIKPSVLRSCTKHCQQQQHTKHCGPRLSKNSAVASIASLVVVYLYLHIIVYVGLYISI